jgi:hypothetical protein
MLNDSGDVRVWRFCWNVIFCEMERCMSTARRVYIYIYMCVCVCVHACLIISFCVIVFKDGLGLKYSALTGTLTGVQFTLWLCCEIPAWVGWQLTLSPSAMCIQDCCIGILYILNLYLGWTFKIVAWGVSRMYKGKKDLIFWVRSTRDDISSFKICEEISLGVLVVDGR